ncbi:secretory protein [Sphingobacterium olei]|uniref:Secretory protein n=1 Tax=Sphingobacterium olei TaxID=2571155 RepID=A0A4U0NAI3_9SPHI|nr:basic secretory protein-like protein [Sphingobacterium olei]TJZ50880.1 secretory protein [Sphingobacterium olei]
MNRNIFIKILTFIVIIGSVHTLKAQGWGDTQQDLKSAVDVDTITKGKFTLVWINKDKDFSPTLKQELIEVYFLNYPKQAKKYNKNTRKSVTFVIDPDYDGVAAAAGGVIRYNPAWFVKNPRDIDVVTHEIMHIVQEYPHRAGPGWITEGIADYVRHVMGVDNEGANWKLTEFNEKHSYKDAYRITARFFYWIEQNYDKKLVVKLDKAMRTKQYTPDFWKKNTGKTIDELWTSYAQNPKLKS